MEEPHFISLDDALYFHEQEILCSGGAKEIRDLNALKAALGAPKATFGGEFLMDLFEMAATYVESICMNHPFLDGNKRTGAVCALTFLYLNGYELNEKYDEELADKILALLNHDIDKAAVAQYFRKQTVLLE